MLKFKVGDIITNGSETREIIQLDEGCRQGKFYRIDISFEGSEWLSGVKAKRWEVLHEKIEILKEGYITKGSITWKYTPFSEPLDGKATDELKEAWLEWNKDEYD